MCEFNIYIVEVKRWMSNLISFSRKYNLLRLFSLAWIERHLSLCQSCIFDKSLLSTEAEAFAQLTIENKEISSAKSLTLDISLYGNSRKSKGPDTDPC